ncbi:MAG: B12-binding domain-containing radical SAM protein [Planctomycetota bacterium]
MKIALINPRIETYSSSLPPLGLLCIGAVLEKENYDVRIFDPLPSDEEDIKKIIDFQPDIIGMSVLTTYVNRAKHIISTLKKQLKSSVLVIGGVHPTALAEESLDFFEADFVVIGEGEITMKELCSRLKKIQSVETIKGIAFRKEGLIIKTSPREPIQDLDELPYPARHLIEFEKYLFPPGVIRGFWSERCTSLMTSRGCPFQCIWCGTQTIFGHKVRRRSVDNVIGEIELLQRDYKIDSLWFVDDTFTLNKKWLLEFCNKLMERRINLKWGCQAHVTTINKEMVDAMKEAGLVQLDFGVESGSERVLRALKKGSTEKAIRNAFYITKKAGVRRMATFMFGNPGEEIEDIKKTFKLAKEIKPDFVSSFFLTPFPGTELMEIAKGKDWLSGEDYSVGGLKKEPMLEIYFSVQELRRIRRSFQRQFFWANFSNLFFNLHYLFNAIRLVICYPKGIIKGLSAFSKTWVFDDFVFAFLIYYAEKRQK